LGAGIGQVPASWDFEADVVVIGAGATGLPAAIKALDDGASVIVVEANFDIGGHAILSGGNVPLGGGTSAQRKYGIQDSPDTVFADLTDWTIVQPNGWPDYRYNDREVMRSFADHCADAYEFLVANGVNFADVPPDNVGAHSTGNSIPRENHALWLEGTGHGSPSGRNGAGLVRPLEASARAKGVKFLFQYRMTSLVRPLAADGRPGRVAGGTAAYSPRTLPGSDQPLQSWRSEGNLDCTQPTVAVRARKAVILATGGSTSNVNFRRMFDPRLTEVYQVAGEPWTFQDGSGEIAAMGVGASLWGLVNQTLENGDSIRTQRAIGARFNYFAWDPASPVFAWVRASGLEVTDWQNVILVNQLGQRFYDETKGDYPNGNWAGEIRTYTFGDFRNTARIDYNPTQFNFFNAAVAMNAASGPPDYAAGPVWAIFDADAAAREEWQVAPPYVDMEGYCFKADSLAELAAKIKNEYQAAPMDGATLEAAVARYNSFVDSGTDLDFDKPTPRYRIRTAPFYAAWATPLIHDSRAGLRINGKCQVVDFQGQVIPGLFCGGESAGGFNQHGLGRCTAQGYTAGKYAAEEPSV
jgi:succinate dehydrogenase/fumarate reductase flavoprotein subunit